MIFGINQDPNTIQSDYGIVDLAFGVRSPDARYEWGLFVKNVFDQQYVTNILPSIPLAGGPTIVQHIPRDFHRYWGATFQARY